MKKLLIFFFVLFIGLALTSCDEKTKYNTNVPTGSLSETTYATLGNYTLTEKDLYNKMRVSGYNLFINELAKLVIPTDGISITTNLDELKDLINKDCYGTTEIDDLSDKDKKTAVTKYIDNMKLVGVTCEENNIYTDSCLNHYLPTLAQKKYAESLIRDTNSKYYYGNEFQKENGEFLLDDNDEQIKNTYYISEDNLENHYEKNMQNDVEFKAIIVGFRTLADLEKSLEDLGSPLVDGQVQTNDPKTLFESLYAKVYDFKDANEYKLTDEDVKTLDASLITTLENLGEGNYTAYPQQVGDFVYLLYSIEEKEIVEYKDINEDTKNEIIEEIIESYLTTSFISNVVNEKIANSDLTIYDPVYDALYAASNEDYKRLEKDQWSNSLNDKVAKIGNKDLTVSAFYNTLEKSIGVSTAMDYFTNKVLLDSEYKDVVTDKELKSIKEQYKTAVEDFEAGNNTNYPTSIGVDNFKFLYYGSTNEDEIYDFYKVQLISEEKTNSFPAKFLESVEKFGKNYYDNYFDLSVKHVLFFVDYDMDGTPDDPQAFLKKLSTENQTKFETALIELMNAYLKEVHYIWEDQEYDDLEGALTFVEKAYIKGENLLSDPTKSWNEYKKFNIGIKVEDLGSVNNESESKYVPEFGQGVQALYKVLKAKAEAEADDKDGFELGDDYLHDTVTTDDLDDISKIIETTYGYHILGVYNSKELKTAKYSADKDTAKQYVDIKVTWNDEEITVENAYSNNEYPSVNQLKIYFGKAVNNQTITQLPSNVKSYIEIIYSEVMERYENATFQNIYLALDLLADISFANTANDTKFAEFITIQKNQLDAYEDYSTTSDKILAGWWDEVNEWIK